MFHAIWTSPWKGPVETLRFHPDQNPLRRGTGIFTDVDGVRWHVHAVMHGRVNARPVSRHPTYYSTETQSPAVCGTGTLGDVVHRWAPHDVEVIPRGG